MDKIDHVASYIFTFLTFFSIAATIYITVLTTVNVISRAVLDNNINAAFETSELAMALIAFGSFPMVSLYNRHIKVDLVVEKFSASKQSIMMLLNNALCGTMMIILSYFTYDKALRVFELGTHQNSTRIPFWPFYYYVAFMLLFAGICCWYNFVHICVTGVPVTETTFGDLKAALKRKKEGGEGT